MKHVIQASGLLSSPVPAPPPPHHTQRCCRCPFRFLLAPSLLGFTQSLSLFPHRSSLAQTRALLKRQKPYEVIRKES